MFIPSYIRILHVFHFFPTISLYTGYPSPPCLITADGYGTSSLPGSLVISHRAAGDRCQLRQWGPAILRTLDWEMWVSGHSHDHFHGKMMIGRFGTFHIQMRCRVLSIGCWLCDDTLREKWIVLQERPSIYDGWICFDYDMPRNLLFWELSIQYPKSSEHDFLQQKYK